MSWNNIDSNFYEFALNNVYEAAFLIDANSRFVYVNEEACRYLGYSREELLNMRVPDIDPDFPISQWTEHWHNLKHHQTLTFERLHQRKDKTFVSVEVKANYFQYGSLEYNLALIRDITERKQIELELNQYKNHLEETVRQRTTDLELARDVAESASRAKSAFLANMSHELRTPLNAILGFSQLLSQDNALANDQREDIDIINRSGEHLLKLINNVLEMSKIEAGHKQLENQLFDLEGLVHDVNNLMQIRAQEKGLQLTLEQYSQIPRFIVGDEAHLRQILINLIGNAIKFTHQGSVNVRLSTQTDVTSHLLIEVEDTGPGILEVDQQRIFEPFEQISHDGDHKGTGLGLTITRQFIELMGGKIDLVSMPGKGSLFSIDLPIQRANFETEIQQQTQADTFHLEFSQPSRQTTYRIMIVEDQIANQQLLSQLMNKLGLEINIAANGVEAIELFQSWRPHLIWMDRKMPVMDGLTATQQIRQLPGGRDVKIIAVTASVFSEQREELLTAGMDDFIFKPYRFEEIYLCMAKHLDIAFNSASQN